MTLITSQAVQAFFADPEVRRRHFALELLDSYTPDMEIQINVAPDGGQPVPNKRNTWTAPYGSSGEKWHHIRIPKNAWREPERNDWPLRFDLATHVEAIGCTGWDFEKRVSRWFGFDFDAIIGHASGHGISDADLEAVKKAAWEVPWLEIRKSTGGQGLHLYVRCCDDGIPTATHTEHAGLGRAILEMLAIRAGFKFTEKVDCAGGNMWIWHRKITQENEGLKLLKQATAKISPSDIPGDWRSHLPVVKGKRATQRVIGVPENAGDQFDDLVSGRRRVPFDDEHKRIMDALPAGGFTMIYQQDNHLVQTHTARLAQLFADSDFGIKGIFKTISQGNDPGKPNCFMFPLHNGGWKVFRFSPGTSEAETWNQNGFWTHCEFNVLTTYGDAVEVAGGFEQSDGSFLFAKVPEALEALKAMGVEVSVPDWALEREMIIRRHKNPQKLIAQMDAKDGENSPTSKQEMRRHRWNLEGKQKVKWVCVVKLPAEEDQDKTDEILHLCDPIIRSLKTCDSQDAGWRLLDAEGDWVERNRTAALDMLARFKLSDPKVIALLQFHNWTLSNLPFQPEFPGGRVWNIGAQLAYQPTEEDRPLSHPHWDMILEHLGKGLNEAVAGDAWCQANGITTGALYLLYWCASLFQKPDQKLPYLFIYGGQEVGKSSLHQGLKCLMSKGYVKAHNSLLTKFNGELDGAILAVVEEVDLSGKALDVYNRMKDWVTGDNISIHAKYVNPYMSQSYVHWIQCANDRYHCPVFEGDSRIVIIHVPKKPAHEVVWREMSTKLKEEAPDFLRMLLDLRLPEGVGRLWLPVLETQAKKDAIAESKDEDEAVGFCVKLANSVKILLLGSATGVFQGLVSELREAVGPGPWADNDAIFGQQLRIALTPERGFQSTFKRTAEGQQVTIKEYLDEDNVDQLRMLEEEYSMSCLPLPGMSPAEIIVSIENEAKANETLTSLGR